MENNTELLKHLSIADLQVVADIATTKIEKIQPQDDNENWNRIKNICEQELLNRVDFIFNQQPNADDPVFLFI